MRFRKRARCLPRDVSSDSFSSDGEGSWRTTPAALLFNRCSNWATWSIRAFTRRRGGMNSLPGQTIEGDGRMSRSNARHASSNRSSNVLACSCPDSTRTPQALTSLLKRVELLEVVAIRQQDRHRLGRSRRTRIRHQFDDAGVRFMPDRNHRCWRRGPPRATSSG